MQTTPTQQREQLYRLLGKLPDRNRLITVKLVATEETNELITEKLLLDLNGVEQVPAYFTKPKGTTEPLPVILFNHSHFGEYGVGKEEFVRGRPQMQQPPYALALAREGYAGFCLDSWCFGERQARGEVDSFKEMLWHGQVLWGMMVFDHLRALDYLQTRPDVDARRIGTLGLSMGSTMACWLAALDERIKVCVDLCCLTEYESLIETNGLSLHGIYYFVPDLLTHFTAGQLNALIAPRPHLSLAGRFDPLTPLAGLEKINNYLRQVYKDKSAVAAWQQRIYDVGHEETAAMRAEILAFLATWL